MGNRALCFDMTRLCLATLRETPRGIERVDHSFARAALTRWRGDVFGLLHTPWGFRLFPRSKLEAIVATVDWRWAEDAPPEADPQFEVVKDWLLGRRERIEMRPHSEVLKGFGAVRDAMAVIRSVGLDFGRDARESIPDGAIYANFGHIGFLATKVEKLLATRADLKAVTLIHDALSIHHPEFFRDLGLPAFRRVLDRAARFSDILFATTRQGVEDLSNALPPIRKVDQRIVPVSPDFMPLVTSNAAMDPELAEHPYFVMCGTLEPRKNHLMMLQVWRELARRPGIVPKLLIIAARGWNMEAVDDLFDRCEPLKGHVALVEGLSSAAYLSFLRQSRGLLMPSFAEGFGLPVAEALALGVPVVASDIPAFREVAVGLAHLRDPLDGPGWLADVVALTKAKPMSLLDERDHRARAFMTSRRRLKAYDPVGALETL